MVRASLSGACYGMLCILGFAKFYVMSSVPKQAYLSETEPWVESSWVTHNAWYGDSCHRKGLYNFQDLRLKDHPVLPIWKYRQTLHLKGLLGFG